MDKILERLHEIELQFNSIDQDKGNVQEYQRTLDMGQVENFNNVEELR